MLACSAIRVHDVITLKRSRFDVGGSQTSLQGKTTTSDDFELGDDEMEPTSSVTFSV